MLKRISQTQQRLKVGSHGEDYGSWMSNPVFYLFGGLRRCWPRCPLPCFT